MFKKLLTTVGDVLTPPRCLGCLQEMTWLCIRCRKHAYTPYQACIICKKKKVRGTTCGSCLKHTRLAGIVSVGSYKNKLLQHGIQWLKFKNIRTLSPLLAELLVPRLPLIAPLKELRKTALLIPIPLHHRRERQRGFNQSFEITKTLSRYTRIPYASLITRSKATWTQSHLPAELRHANMSQAFSLKKLPAKRLIIIIDDVTTTGSTISSAASVFPHGYTVWGCTVARG